MAGNSRGTPAAFQKGHQVGPYQIIDVLTPTRFGDIYLARHPHQPMPVLIEGFLPPLAADELKADFLKEAQILKNIEHPQILHIRDAGVHRDYPFLVTDHLPDRTFSQVYALTHPQPLRAILPHLKKIASALHDAHRQRVVHGDVRPENILLSPEHTPVLRGFLLAAIMQNRGRLNYRGMEAAELDAMIYAAPEQIQGHGGFASDQYAVGVLLYTLLCGEAPFTGSAVEIAFQKIHAPVLSLRQKQPDSILPGVERVVMRALEQEPERRFPDVQAFIDALEQEADLFPFQFQTAAPVQPMGSSTPPPASPSGPLATTPPAPAAPALQSAGAPATGVAPMPITPSGDPPEEPPRQKSQKPRKRARQPAPGASAPPPRQRPAHSNGATLSRRVFAFGVVTFAALGGVGGWYLLSQRFAHAAPPALSPATGPSATQTTVNNQPGLIFTGHLASVNAVAWSPDGKSIASASDDTFVQVFEAATGTRTRIYRGHTEEVAAVTWSPNGKLLASAGQDRTVQIWNAASGGLPVRIYRGHTDRVNGVSWARDGQLLVSGSDDKSVQVWQTGNGDRIFTFLGHTAGVLCVGWQPNQSSVASGSWDGTLRDWATVQHGDHFNAGDQIFDYGGHGKNEVYALAWSPDARYIVSAGADQTVQFSSGVDGTPRPPLFADHRRQDHVNRVFAVAWSPDGASIASGDEDGNVYVWTVTDRKTFFRYAGHKGAVNAVAWSPDGKFIASGGADATVQVWQPGS